ncbi:acyl carrier protein [Citrifermentans bemidjiense Bem]|uniref:Acyl carrier protein n=1 Tax=Citrifermentans bemidjiense (strain ATCC BAA-1014 / DSM 16622 / JCM 12645 / Bem) TaxID=404380 RepID=B5EH02_CITBB|nr:acyl carrier protein [Citrifermentans bemidjiense]ACH38104.1 acyl carrier protein [Citrifermentans bemidjiense Bem]
MSLQEDIRSFIVDNFLFGDAGTLNNDSSFIKEGIVDSTGILQLVAFIQEQYRVVVEDEELIPENLDSVSKVAAFIENKMKMAAFVGEELEVAVGGADGAV